jgi:hypothetical protein
MRVGDPREHEGIGGERRRLGEEELGVARHVLRIAMMLPVKDAIVPVRPEGEEARHRAHHRVQPAAAEGRAMRRLVEDAEEKDEDVPVGDHQGHRPRRGGEPPQQSAGDRERPEVPESAQQGGSVGADHEGVEIVARQLVRGELDEGGITHSPSGDGSDTTGATAPSPGLRLAYTARLPSVTPDPRSS